MFRTEVLEVFLTDRWREEYRRQKEKPQRAIVSHYLVGLFEILVQEKTLINGGEGGETVALSLGIQWKHSKSILKAR